LESEWDEFEGFIDELSVPFFYVPGNHDMTNEVMAEIWEKRFGPAYYHFIYKNVLFLCLNSEDMYRAAGRGSISQPQFEYAKEVLNKYPDVRHTLVFMHQPLWNQSDPKQWPEVERMLNSREHTVFVGHNHNYVKYERNNGKYFVLATTGGSSRLRGPDMGEFDHVVWVTMHDEGPIIANLLLDGIRDENVMTEPRKELISSLLRHSPITVEPLYYDGETFKGGTYQFKVTNPLNTPLQLTATSGFGWDLTGEIDHVKSTLTPGSTESISINLMKRNAKPTSSFRSLPIQLRLSLNDPNLGRMDIPFSYHIKPIRKRQALSPANRLNIDADLADWPPLRYSHKDSEVSDNHVEFDIAMDDQYIYLAAKVKDDNIIVDPNLPSWRQDGFGWTVALGKEPDLAVAGSGASFRITPGHGSIGQKHYRSDRWPKNLQYIANSKGDGYSVELRIPIDMLAKEDDDWEQVRINFYIDDKDSEELPVRLNWQPTWRGTTTFVGTGLFFKP
jgi:hypothetical protein